MRTFSKQNHDDVPERIARLARGIAEAHGLTADVDHASGYPVTVNDEAAYALMTDTVVDLFGADRYVEMPFPEAGAEDFSYVLEQVPGAYIFVSAYPARRLEHGRDQSLVAGPFDIAVLADRSAPLAEVVLRRLRQADRGRFFSSGSVPSVQGTVLSVQRSAPEPGNRPLN